jgi:hypothetical protein
MFKCFQYSPYWLIHIKNTIMKLNQILFSCYKSKFNKLKDFKDRKTRGFHAMCLDLMP